MTRTSPVGRRLGATLSLALAAGLCLGAVPASASGAVATGSSSERAGSGLRPVVYVGNNWAGTVDLVLPGSFERVARINAVPDKERRMAEIQSSPDKLAYFLAVRELIGEGHDQLVDDMYSSSNGRFVVASRPSFADVVAISLRTGKIKWRFTVDGYRADHMAMSPDGRRVAISASTANKVHVLRVADGTEVGSFPSGDSPHESVFIDGGKKILHAAIGRVYTPTDRAQADTSKGETRLEIVNARTLKITKMINVRRALDERGLTHVSDAVRPLTLSPHERFIYFQVSFFHGFLEYDRRTDRITRVKRLPNLVKDTPREEYLLDSAHHGIAMNPRGSRICVAGTMSNYATVVNRGNFARGPLLEGGKKPYWVTPSADGKSCYISWSGTDSISKISYKTRQIVETTKVGDHPQRVRNGVIRRHLLSRLRG